MGHFIISWASTYMEKAIPRPWGAIWIERTGIIICTFRRILQDWQEQTPSGDKSSETGQWGNYLVAEPLKCVTPQASKFYNGEMEKSGIQLQMLGISLFIRCSFHDRKMLKESLRIRTANDNRACRLEYQKGSCQACKKKYKKNTQLWQRGLCFYTNSD